MLPETEAMPLVPRQLVRPTWSHRRQHDRHVRRLKRLEQHPPPIARPHDPQTSHVRFLHDWPFQPCVHRFRGPPAFGGIRSARCIVDPRWPTAPRSIRRPVFAARVVVYVRRSIPTERLPNSSIRRVRISAS
jgi:hypothetical protein